MNSVSSNKKGSALLVAMLIMGVLISISLVLSVLILRETRITRDMIDSGKAYYAAESGIEIALYKLKNELPGWEPDYFGDDASTGDGFISYLVNDEDKNTVVGELKVDNRCNAYPCFEEGFDLENTQFKPELRSFYDVLELNESVTIPLFVVDNNGDEVPVGEFAVEFFAPFNPKEHLKIASNEISGWDVLRWKIFGIDPIANITETISDFTAINMLSNGAADDSGDFVPSYAENPSWFGSLHNDLADVSDSEKNNRYTKKAGVTLNLNQYSLDAALGIETNEITDEELEEAIAAAALLGEDIDEEDIEGRGEILDSICYPWEAREYYDYTGVGEDRHLNVADINDCYPIDTFIQNHKLKYLSLTNLMNPAVFNDYGEDKIAKLSRIFYRVEFFNRIDIPAETAYGVATGNQTVREFADITAKGYSGNNTQSINVKIKRGSFMPVFNFSLYSTYKEGNASKNEDAVPHDNAYWYGDDA